MTDIQFAFLGGGGGGGSCCMNKERVSWSVHGFQCPDSCIGSPQDEPTKEIKST